jgi:hypothetical protein
MQFVHIWTKNFLNKGAHLSKGLPRLIVENQEKNDSANSYWIQNILKDNKEVMKQI